MAALNNGDRNVRWRAAAALGEIKDVRAVEPLAAALKDSDSDVRCAAAEALSKIGDKRTVTALAAALPDWDCQKFICGVLVGWGWQPQTEREQVYLWICQRQTSELAKSWEQVRRILLEDVLSRDKRRMDNAVFTFISLGREEIISELVKILDEHGHKEMAETYLNSGHQGLDTAARDWARRHGYAISTGAGSHEASWGSWR